MNEPDVATPRQLSLRLLGTADLRDENGDELRSVLVAPKRLVLLAYLALTAPNYQRRDVLLPLLWPDLTTVRTRQALRSLLQELQQGVGDGVLAPRRGARRIRRVRAPAARGLRRRAVTAHGRYRAIDA